MAWKLVEDDGSNDLTSRVHRDLYQRKDGTQGCGPRFVLDLRTRQTLTQDGGGGNSPHHSLNRWYHGILRSSRMCKTTDSTNAAVLLTAHVLDPDNEGSLNKHHAGSRLLRCSSL